MFRVVAAVAVAAAFAVPAIASSPDAWAEHEAAVTQACATATGFKNAKAHTKLIMFDDSVGYDAIIITGEWPNEHMMGATGEMLCLYNKSTQTAVVSEFEHVE